jgi:hypothetical protein
MTANKFFGNVAMFKHLVMTEIKIILMKKLKAD